MVVVTLLPSFAGDVFLLPLSLPSGLVPGLAGGPDNAILASMLALAPLRELPGNCLPIDVAQATSRPASGHGGNLSLPVGLVTELPMLSQCPMGPMVDNLQLSPLPLSGLSVTSLSLTFSLLVGLSGERASRQNSLILLALRPTDILSLLVGLVVGRLLLPKGLSGTQAEEL